MVARVFHVVLQLRSPMHIGRGKVGNVQRTRGYVTGRAMWGALTLRLTRDRMQQSTLTLEPVTYEQVGLELQQGLAFSYLYPTVDSTGKLTQWPWQPGFDSRFLSTYPSTALVYPERSADEGSLHEIEFVSPYTLDTGEPVFLSGYLFEGIDVPGWKQAMARLQLGGERGYGWGQVNLVRLDELGKAEDAAKSPYAIWPGCEFVPVLGAPRLKLQEKTTIYGHLDANRALMSVVEGPLEPLMGRETVSASGAGQQVVRAKICYAPGSVVKKPIQVQIGPFGAWEIA